MKSVFVTGANGFIGRRLIAALLQRGHAVTALVRPGSEGKIPAGARVLTGDPLNAASYRNYLDTVDTFVHLIGVAHPKPHMKDQFWAIDFKSGEQAVIAASEANVNHFMYLSVAQPAPIMKDYLKARAEVEAFIHAKKMNATIFRPWYVLGPGRWWPVLLLPVYGVMKLFPTARPSAERLGLITIYQLVRAMVVAVENPPVGIRVLGVPEIKRRQKLTRVIYGRS